LIVTKTADIIIIGHGTGDALQLTLQAQHVLDRFGFAFAIGAPPLLTKMLTASGVELEHLDERMLAASEPSEALLAAADVILKQVEVEQPVIVLVPGNPLFLNSLSRFLVAEGGARKLVVQRLAGISQLDVIINELGIDVAARGIQVFDAAGIAAGRSQPDPRVPTVLLRVVELVSGNGLSLDDLKGLLGATYPGSQPVTLFNIDPTSDATSHATAPLSQIATFGEHVHAGSSFFLGPISA
jgi:uncharacterized protein YabN with tetrapyrrole methylase and pyrophosphatase domain